MKVLVDTSIWSLAFRRKKTDIQNKILVTELTNLIQEFKASIIGPIRQEILSGIKDKKQYEILKEHLRAFEDLTINTKDYEIAAEFYNLCRQKGIQGSHIDFLICAVSFQNKMPIFTTDKDFQLYSSHLKIKLYKPSGSNNT